ncbi:hypothetical protein [Bradyrhizobium sp. 139]|uniref:hypothetical protein n=1 Tax=Bradyrhizobium sp. 139 TaxID=2782616 RepID=UPI001FFA1746|nr:hypothetical protein [Bradyrhizobium sp. 139]
MNHTNVAADRANQHRPVARMERSAIQGQYLHGWNPGLRCAPSGLRGVAFLSGKTREPQVNAYHRKYSTLPKFGNGVCVAATRPKEEGRIAIVTNAGRTAVDVGYIGAKGFAGRAIVSEDVARTTGVIGVRQNRVVLTPGVCASSLVVMCVARPGARISYRQGDGGNSASLPGESTT